MRKSLILGIASIAVLVLMLDAAPGYALRCGTKLVSSGDSAEQVIAKCGVPSEITVWNGQVGRAYSLNPTSPDSTNTKYGRGYSGQSFSRFYPTIENWTYNFGSTRFVRYLRFENGVLKRITTGGYGK
jgi:hypothetical protein